MKFLGVELRVPDLLDLRNVPLCAAIGVIIGLGLLFITHGHPGVVIAEGAAAVAAGLLAVAGANASAGWRGVTICLAGSLCAYGAVLRLL